jgi:photosystem I P700 chlorophyll a apoprotein A1
VSITSFKKFSQPGFFSPKLSKDNGKKLRPQATTWIWNLHADAHDFDCQTTSLEEISRKIFSAHFGQLAIIFLWLSGMFFHGARFSNYSAWLECPTLVTPSSHVVWPIVGQGILNGDVGGGFAGIQITSGWFGLWRACGIVNETELYAVAFGGLIASWTMLFAGWFHYHKAAPRLEWFQNAESMLNHHLAGLLGLGCLSWAGHQIHVSLPINKLLDAGIAPQDVPLPHEFLFNQELMGQLYPSFKKGLLPFFTFNWGEYSDFLTFKGGLNPITGSLWLSDVAHHHLSLSVIFIFAGHMYRTNWGIGHSIQELLAAHAGPIAPGRAWAQPVGSYFDPSDPNKVRTGRSAGHMGLYEVLTTSWHAQLAINLAMLGSLSIIVAHHMYAMPPYPYLSIDYSTQVSLFVHHVWIGGFCIVGAGAHASIFMVRDYSPLESYGTLIDASLRNRDAIIAHLNWVSIFLGMHSFGLYIHNDTLCALGLEADCFADGAIELQPIFARWIQSVHALAPVSTAPNTLATASYVFGGEISVVDGRIGIMPIGLGTSDFLVHHIHAFNIHVAALILLKGVLFARSSALIPDKADQGFRFPCDGPGRGGTCQVSAWDHVFLAAFWMYNCISIVIFYFTWKMPADVWGTVSEGKISHLLEPFAADYDATQSYTVNGWFRDYLWAGSLSVIDSYGSELSAYGLIFLGAHFIWAFSLMFLFSGRGYWQELIESILWAHSKLNITPEISPRALSITQGRAVGLAHYLLGGIGVTWSFLLSGFAV